MRPTLLPNLRRLWRDAQTLQLGSDPDQAVVLRLARPAASRALDLLDGSATISGLVAGAEKLGLDGRDVEEIVDLLRRLGLVLGAHELTPSSLPEGVRRRLHVEAAAIALRRRTHPRATTRHADQHTASRADPRAASEADQHTASRADPRAASEADQHTASRADPRAASEADQHTASRVHQNAASGHADQPRTTAAASQQAPTGHTGQPTASRADPHAGDRAHQDAASGHADQHTASRADRHAAAGSRTDRRGTTPIARPAAARREQPRSPTPADILRRRAEACVLVAGDGPLVAPVAAALAAAGVGHIDPALDGVIRPGDVLVGGFGAADVRRPRAVATADAVTRAAPGTDLSPATGKRAAFLVQFGARPSATLGARAVRLRHLPVLEVAIRLGTVVVGPLVRPRASPCRDCLELHRRDRDPAWPVLKAQLATAPTGDEEPCAQTTALAGAAYAAEEVLSYLDGAQPRTEAAIVEIARPGEIRRRAWAAHPRCDCRRRRRVCATTQSAE